LKDLRDYTGREIVMLWASGAVLVAGLLVAARAVQRPVMRSGLNEYARMSMLARERERELDSAYVAYARAHPEDSAAQADARRRTAIAASTRDRDSTTMALVQRGVLDTAYNARARSERGALGTLSAFFGIFTLLGSALAVPFVLTIATLWWGIGRNRRRRDGRPARTHPSN